jgi:hypothetical protein
MRSMTYLLFQYARVRCWMEQAPRRERWPWYWLLVIWCYTTYSVAI